MFVSKAEVNFANFNPAEHSVYEIGGDVIPQIAEVFGHNLTTEPDEDNLGQLIGAVGPKKELQENIDKAVGRIGDSDDATELARSWVEKSGLLLPVERSFTDPDLDMPIGFESVIITGGVANWMHRRAEKINDYVDSSRVMFEGVTLVAGFRPMKEAERADVIDGYTEADYMEEVIAKKLVSSGIAVKNVINVDSQVGDDVAEAAVEYGMTKDTKNVLVVSNAGAWVQNAGQIGRAMKRRLQLHENIADDQLFVVSDGFPLGTGEEPTSTHQNPFSALGQIARNAQELVRWQG